MARRALGLTVVASVVLGCACSSAPNPPLPSTADNPSINYSAIGNNRYFPPGSVDSQLTADWLAPVFRQAHVSPLPESPANQAYRVSWLPAFRGGVIVEVAENEGRWSAVVLELDETRTGFENRRPSNRYTVSLTPHDIEALRSDLVDAAYWNSKFLINSEVSDGWALLLERWQNGKLTVLVRMNTIEQSLSAAVDTMFRAVDVPNPLTARSEKTRQGLDKPPRPPDPHLGKGGTS